MYFLIFIAFWFIAVVFTSVFECSWIKIGIYQLKAVAIYVTAFSFPKSIFLDNCFRLCYNNNATSIWKISISALEREYYILLLWQYGIVSLAIPFPPYCLPVYNQEIGKLKSHSKGRYAMVSSLRGRHLFLESFSPWLQMLCCTPFPPFILITVYYKYKI